MKPQQFADVLKAQAAMLAETGAAGDAWRIGQLAAALAKSSSTNWKALGTLMVKNGKGALAGPTAGEDAIASLAPALTSARNFLTAVGSKSAKDYADISAILQGVEGLRLLDLSLLVEAPKSELVPSGAKKPGKVKPTELEQQKLAREIADRLTVASRDHGLFQVALAEVKAAKHSKDMVTRIANRFLGTSGRFDSISAAFTLIEERHRMDLNDASSGRIIDRIAS